MLRRPGKKASRIIAAAAIAVAAMPLLGAGTFFTLDRIYPLPPIAEVPVSAQVVDRDGKLLRAFATEEGRWRLPVSRDEVDPQFVRMLVAYEDKRFRDHHGVDPVAMLRASLQFATSGHIVSGGSTLTMQLARLMEVGDTYIGESIVGSRFTGRIVADATVGGRPAIIPSISGRAWITGTHQHMLDPGDPWPSGYRISDTWPMPRRP